MFVQNYFLILVLGALFNGTTEAKNKTCIKILHEVADVQGKFVDCMVRFSFPAKSCIDCYKHHENATIAYKRLNANCSSTLINNNRLNIVYNMQNTLIDVWNKGLCDDCLDPERKVPSNETIEILQLDNEFSDCLNNSHTNPCNECGNKYEKLNYLYKKMEEAKKGQICFDIQDAMNKSRSHWSKDLNCCHREYSFTLFIIASSLFGVLPIVFYFGMYGYTKHLEQNHEVLDAHMNAEQQPSTSTGVLSGTTSNNIERQSTREANTSHEENIDELKRKHISSEANPNDLDSMENPKLQREHLETERPNPSNTLLINL